ncbi:translocator protein, LysE family [Klebsiella pneumoniae]|uniref:Translocator protein, LysE family n=8 Tax=Enterobacterales TaxID=91347 RepID=A0A2X1SG52_KLEPN|nr:translocator protein, LysE family [Klebsiella pneumoniae]
MLVTDSLLAYTLAATLLTLTPGLDTALILRTATAEGGRKALHAALGIDLGCFIWGALVAFGLGALLAVSELAYTLLKWCGAGYLCWLGIQLLLRPRQQFNTHPAESDSTSNWFLRGMLGNVLNPKMGVFYVSFLPQFIPAGHSPISWTFLLVTIHVLIGTLWSLTLITATRYGRRHPEKTGRSEMDGPNDRLPVSVVCREAGHESAVVTQGRNAPVFALKNEQPVEYYSVVKRSGSNVRLASFFCKTMTIIGVPDAVIAHTANSVSLITARQLQHEILAPRAFRQCWQQHQ